MWLSESEINLTLDQITDKFGQMTNAPFLLLSQYLCFTPVCKIIATHIHVHQPFPPITLIKILNKDADHLNPPQLPQS